MLLKTERLTIRHIVADDWKSIKEIWVDFNASEYAQYDMPHITDDADVKARMAKWAAANSGTEHMFFAVCLGETVIGYIVFNIRENGYEIGYCFHSAYHGKGYARESHLALFDYLRTLGITKFSAGTALNNTPSVKLLTALGFKLVEQEKVSFYKDDMGNDIVFDGGIFEKESMEIRKLVESDYDQVIELYVQLDEFHVQARPDCFIHRERDKIYPKDAFIHNLSYPGGLELGAFDGDLLVGILRATLWEESFMRKDLKTVCLDDIYVLPTYRRRGIAAKLFSEVESWAKEQGAIRLDLHTWDFNKGAIAMYEAMGMTPQRYVFEKKL